MGDFQFTESQWEKISAELGPTGRQKWDGDRLMLEKIICGPFAQLRPKLGRNAPTPARARNAWRDVAAAARKLEVAIAGLRAAGAADFALLDWLGDGHRGGWKNWSEQLSLLKQAADWAAKLEMAGARTVSNKTDPMLYGFVKRLATIWEGFGGRLAHTEHGPLTRFLSAVTAPVLESTREKPMTTGALRGCVRRIIREEKKQREEDERRIHKEEKQRERMASWLQE